MGDTFTKAERSRIMAAVKSQDTTPEMVVRRLVHGLGFRYRLHDGTLPGRPDLVLPSRRKIIFIHGCFWHRHRCEAGRSMPASRVDYWRAKFARNQTRDRKVRRQLAKSGWRVLVIWECQTRNLDRLRTKVKSFLYP
ncbi:MAG: DNA mismatch endonuclease Vsr [Planctomycetota bacterium]|nr:DNA mismatch endonuclease Vsr [Planctomycetota bacterium]